MGPSMRKKKPHISSPADGIVTYDDVECNASYIDLPSDFEFVESAAYNEEFNSNTFYIPVQRNGCQTFIYEATINSTEVKPVMGPITLKDEKWTDEEKVKLTAFGSELDPNGLLWLCVFNRNLLVAVDLKSRNPIAKHEIEVFAPNDVCLDPRDPNVLYAVVGKKRALFTDPSAGKVKMIRLRTDANGKELPPEIIKISRGKNTLAGIEATDEGEVIVAQLFNVFRLTQPKGLKTQQKFNFWKSQEFWKANDGNGKLWLADNISPLGYDRKTFMIPAYNTCSASVGSAVLRSRGVTAAGNFTTQIVSGIKNREGASEMLENPEVDVGFSNNDSEDPLRFIKMSNFVKGKYPHVEHFEVHLKDAHSRTEHIQPGRKFFFDTNVTAVLSVKDKLICINFQQPRLLLLDLDKFYTAEGQREIVEMSNRMNEEIKKEQDPEDTNGESTDSSSPTPQDSTPEAEAAVPQEAPAATSLMAGAIPQSEPIQESAPSVRESVPDVVSGSEERNMAGSTTKDVSETGSARLDVPQWKKALCGVCGF